MLDHAVSEYQEYIPRNRLANQPSASPEQKPSPSASKTSAGKKAAQQRMARQATIESAAPSLPKSPVGHWGVANQVLQLIEVRFPPWLLALPPLLTAFQVSAILTLMEPIIQHSRAHTNISPNEALRQLVQRGPNPAHAHAGAGMPPDAASAFNPSLVAQTPGQRTPGQPFPGGPPPQPGVPPGPPQFASPAQAAHLNLPNAGSPAAMAMSPAVKGHGLPPGGGPPGGPAGAPPGGAAMVAQISHQGSSSGAGGGGSQGTSANTSPHVTNKKRRASAVKVEMDDGPGAGPGPEVNGTKVKASPRMPGSGKRQK